MIFKSARDNDPEKPGCVKPGEIRTEIGGSTLSAINSLIRLCQSSRDLHPRKVAGKLSVLGSLIRRLRMWTCYSRNFVDRQSTEIISENA